MGRGTGAHWARHRVATDHQSESGKQRAKRGRAFANMLRFVALTVAIVAAFASARRVHEASHADAVAVAAECAVTLANFGSTYRFDNGDAPVLGATVSLERDSVTSDKMACVQQGLVIRNAKAVIELK